MAKRRQRLAHKKGPATADPFSSFARRLRLELHADAQADPIDRVAGAVEARGVGVEVVVSIDAGLMS